MLHLKDDDVKLKDFFNIENSERIGLESMIQVLNLDPFDLFCNDGLEP